MNNRGILGMMIMAAITNLLFAPLSALMPLWVTRHFMGGEVMFSIFSAASGVGIIVGSLTLSAWGGFQRRTQTVILGFGLLGIGIVAASLVPADLAWLGVATVFFSLIALAFINAPTMAIMQAVVEPELQGRVFTLTGMLSTLMTPIGLLIAGPFADTIGVRPWFFMAGIVALLVGLGGWLTPVVMLVEDTIPVEEEDEAFEPLVDSALA